MNILVVDDHVLIREALRGALKELDGDPAIFEASTGSEAMDFVAQHADVDLILLDLTLPDRDGFSVLAELRERHPGVSVVVMSALQDRDNVVKALDLGALGFIPKSAQRKVIITALQLVISGGIYIPPQILERADQPTGASAAPSTQPIAALSSPQRMTAANRDGASPSDLGLTGRQLDVLALMVQGKSNKAICRALDLAEPTVKNHVTAILKALKVTNRTEAVIMVHELKWALSQPAGN
jgi:DNA-binding NarL/FixJ family response regulator